MFGSGNPRWRVAANRRWRRPIRPLSTLALAILLLVPASTGAGQTVDRTLTVGTKETPPFAIKRSDGSWGGISIELWRRIADELGVETELVETDLQGLLQGVRDGRFDASVAAITITPDRERDFDFSHPIYSTGLAIAARSEGGGWLTALRAFFSLAFLRVVLLLLALLLVVGFAAWLFERRHNPEQFERNPVRGVGSGLWWAAVTMTTVGYGDKAPASLGGRIVALVWMFTAIIIISGFTAAITTALTVSRLDTKVKGPGDLYRVQTATVSGSASAGYLEANHIVYEGYPGLEDALLALAGDDVDAVVYDAPLLRYQVNRRADKDLVVLPQVFERQDFAILLPSGSTYREPINRILLEQIKTSWWDDLLETYLGR
jgi:polar amino acid transport system substrate-binding protein